MIDAADKQAIVLALAELALRRPGWQAYCRSIATEFGPAGAPMFDEFQTYSRDAVKAIETIETPFPHAKALRPEPAAVAALAERIRPLVRAASPELAAAALSYELAAVLAREAVPLIVADLAIDQTCEIMKLQVRAFGTGKEHP